jgi:aconitase B
MNRLAGEIRKACGIGSVSVRVQSDRQMNQAAVIVVDLSTITQYVISDPNVPWRLELAHLLKDQA